MRFVSLTENKRILIQNLYKKVQNHVERERCDFLMLSEKRFLMQDISSIKNVGRHCVSNFFNAWEKAVSIEEKMACLRIKEGRGAKMKLTPVEGEIPRTPFIRTVRNLQYQDLQSYVAEFSKRRSVTLGKDVISH